MGENDHLTRHVADDDVEGCWKAAEGVAHADPKRYLRYLQTTIEKYCNRFLKNICSPGENFEAALRKWITEIRTTWQTITDKVRTHPNKKDTEDAMPAQTAVPTSQINESMHSKHESTTAGDCNDKRNKEYNASYYYHPEVVVAAWAARRYRRPHTPPQTKSGNIRALRFSQSA